MFFFFFFTFSLHCLSRAYCESPTSHIVQVMSLRGICLDLPHYLSHACCKSPKSHTAQVIGLRGLCFDLSPINFSFWVAICHLTYIVSYNATTYSYLVLIKSPTPTFHFLKFQSSLFVKTLFYHISYILLQF